MMSPNQHIHQPARLQTGGMPLQEARRVMIMIHGRGADARSMLQLAPHFRTEDMAFVAPEATGNTWYPHSFLAPVQDNEPGLSSGLQVLQELVDQHLAAGFMPGQIYLLGFSQGACLTLEFAARNPRGYGGVFGLSGGLIGPPETPRTYTGNFAGAQVFLGCSDVDSHIPKERVLETASVLERMGAVVITRLYPGAPHTILEDEIQTVIKMLG